MLFLQDVEITVDDLKDLYENLITETDDLGRVIAEMFMQLPDPEVSFCGVYQSRHCAIKQSLNSELLVQASKPS